MKTKIKSSMMVEMEYNEEQQELLVEFTNGDRYKYSEVDEETIEEWLEASSQGKFFCKHIQYQFEYEKVE